VGFSWEVSSATDGTASLRSGDLPGAPTGRTTSLIANWYEE
jgi:hypothetical protein